MRSRLSPPELTRGDALFLDFDGTLVQFADRPDRIRVDPALPRLLARLQRALEGAVAVVTGRRLESIDRYLAPLKPYGAGLHGAELRDAQGHEDRSRDIGAALRRAAAELRRRYEHDPEVWLEDKGGALALHYRAAPQRAPECLRIARALAEEHGLSMLVGKQVAELRPPGVDKGAAIQALMTRPPFQRRRPVFAGDDATDEDGFAAVEAMGGVSVKVGDGPTGARYRLADEAETRRWLEGSLAALEVRLPPAEFRA